jgi:hypothetical protein
MIKTATKVEIMNIIAATTIIGTMSLSSLVIITTPAYAVPPSAGIQQYCYTARDPSGGTQQVCPPISAIGDQSSACKAAQAMDPNALSPCHRQGKPT